MLYRNLLHAPVARKVAAWKNVPVQEDLWKRIEKRAKEENRSVAKMAAIILAEALPERGR